MRLSQYISAFLVAFSLTTSANAITIRTVPVGDAGNGGDPEQQFKGAVDYAYRIGATEVTVGQYAAFLNAVAATDTYSLYNTQMATDLTIAGIARTGQSGSYSYSVIGSSNHPVTYVNYGDAVRFCNWLHNGQPTGAQGLTTTERGAYQIDGATTAFELGNVFRTDTASWFVPRIDEWYKAAYYQPANKGGDSDNYWRYPMRSNFSPYSDQPPGGAPDNTRVGNFFENDGLANGCNDGYAVTGATSYNSSQNYLTDVGAYVSSASYYGTFDQGGNVKEWTEQRIDPTARYIWGGSWEGNSGYQQAGSPQTYGSLYEGNDVGFRVASIPEPGSMVLCLAGMFILATTKKGR